eukprot:TRINITY_DN15282_c0_g1_i1.p1 TRINITY_DN15282_c0_g1~~TRINITY_DN15282_c0_g1_i1.p1  ORF type:complete len:540 (-),score=94.29 TRINITY_DN15282_c0_g1_i1:60-1616(-)
MEALVEQFAKGAFSSLPDLIKITVKNERDKDTASRLVTFCKDQDQLEGLLNFVIKEEITRTTHPATLFREDSFLMTLLNEIMFSDAGTRYLQQMTKPLVEAIIKKSVAMKLQLNTADPSKNQANTRRMIKLVQQFIDRFVKSPYSCPISLRATFAALHACVYAKFKDRAFRSPVLDLVFFKFFCPCVIDPSRFEVVEKTDIPPESKPVLLTVSKLLNDLALKNIDKWGDEINEFIANTHSLLIDHFALLTDEKRLEEHKTVLLSSGLLQVPTQSQKTESWNGLVECIRQASVPTEILTPEDLAATKVVKLQEYHTLIDDPKWKYYKEIDGGIVQILPTEGALVIAKCTVLVNAPLQYVRKMHPIVERTKYGVSKMAYGSMAYETEGFHVYYYVAQPFYPLADREVYQVNWICKESDDVWIHVYQGAPKGMFPAGRGNVPAIIGVSGVQFEAVGNKTKVTQIANADFRGTLPSWAKKLGYNLAGGILPRIGKMIELGWRDPQALEKKIIAAKRSWRSHP